MAAQTGHIRKRPYQPSITSFFNNRNIPSNSAPESAVRSPLSPPLPPDTQASLLSVGMRVRKSVPEGYKTHKTLQEYPFPSTAPVTQKSQRAYGGASTNELVPFCGLHKIGGWGMQENPSSSAPTVMSEYSGFGNDMPGMSTSQSTMSSTQGSFGGLGSAPEVNSRKRTYEDEVEEELDAYFEDFGTESLEPRLDRPIAKVKGTTSKVGHTGGAKIVGGIDFEEAAFLSPFDTMEVEDA